MAELTSSWITILMAGTTIDGRTVEDKDLTEIADTYDPAVYEASINADHYRHGLRYGRVAEVRLSKHATLNKTTLQARLVPNAFFLEMNKHKQKLHTSCELRNNFAGTGRTYLMGLAITDNPASLGTDRIEFSCGDQSKKFTQAMQLDSESIPFSTNSFVARIGESLKADSVIEANPFSLTPQPDDNPNPTEPLDMSLTAQQARELFTELLSEHNNQEAAPAAQAKKPDAEPAVEPAALESSAQADFKPISDQLQSFSQEFKGFNEQIVKLTAAIDELKQAAPSTSVDENTGAAGEYEDIF
jgi:soluble cytochrome b562